MNRLTIVMLAGASSGAENRKQTFTGVITDAMCGADHSAMGVKPDASACASASRTAPSTPRRGRQGLHSERSTNPGEIRRAARSR